MQIIMVNCELLYCHFSGLDDPTNQSMMFKNYLSDIFDSLLSIYLLFFLLFSFGHRIECQKDQSRIIHDFDLDINRKKNPLIYMEQYGNI